MSEQEYENLWHYSEQFTRDKLQRSELITMAWQQQEKLGDHCTLGLMKSMMHFRSKELNKRSAFPLDEVGKRKKDAWNHDRVYIDRPVKSDADQIALAEFLLPVKITPLDFTITNDFLSALTTEERLFLDDLTAGYSMKDISKHTRNIPSLRQSLQQKAVDYL
ncbi:MAG: hypothetical protein ABSC53_12165 [Bacteroidota bacterium]